MLDDSTRAPSFPGSVLVMGAGAVGCWIGGSLQAIGVPVTLVGRPPVLDALRDNGLTLTDLEGGRRTLPGALLDLQLSVPERATPALVLLCVKSVATAEAAATLARCLPPDTLVVSMQNGISNAALAQAQALALTVRPGLVPFNVAELAPGHYHRGTAGSNLAAKDHPALRAWQPVFDAAGLPLALHSDLTALQWGKLLMNLNNPVNALAQLPLREQLLQRDYRVCLAALIDEALRALAAAQIVPARLSPLPPVALPTVLRLPTPLFRLLAARLLRIDAKARSSMADDLARGKPTEIDALCGEVVRLALAHGASASVNTKMTELVHAWPADPRPRSGAELRTALGL